MGQKSDSAGAGSSTVHPGDVPPGWPPKSGNVLPVTIKPRKPVGEDGDHVARLVTEDHGARSCTQCAHLPVCVVIRGLTSGCQAAFQGVDSKDWPVTPSSLAIICRAYAVRFEGVRA